MTKNSIYKNNLNRSKVGVVGGGQLAQMLANAAKKQNIKVIIQSPSETDPAAKITDHIVLAKPSDPVGTKKLLQYCDAITFENEWVNINELEKLEMEGASFYPPISALEPLVDKIAQRTLLDNLNIPGPDWIELTSDSIGSAKLPKGWDFPLMAKIGRGGYDGKGTRVINSFSDLNQLLLSVNREEWFLEKWVSFERELALVASRDKYGKIQIFPIVETSQIDQICNWVLAPADIEHSVEILAQNIVSSLLTHLNYKGVLAIEFFYGPCGLLVNEIAPRTHNSGHYTIDACNTSQFEQQLSVVIGNQIVPPKLVAPGAFMVNLLGLQKDHCIPLAERISQIKKLDGAYFHWYDKSKETQGRKMGHVTFLLSEKTSNSRREEAFKKLEIIRMIWPN